MCHLTEGDMVMRWWWCLCYCLAGVFACIALASLPSLCWGLCPCCAVICVLLVLAGVSTVVALALSPYCDGIIALVALASLPEFCTGINHPHCAGVFTIVLLALSPKAHNALVSFPLFHWCCHHCCVVCAYKQHINAQTLYICLIWIREPA
jgi:hypothetical protein